MIIIPHGAAREVTGTCHEIQANGKRILLDCGLFQGRRQESYVKNHELTFDPTRIDAVVLSHAHADHAGRIPLLWKRGYTGRVHSTYATEDLCEVMLADSGYIQEKDEEYHRKKLAKSMIKTDGPLYTQEDAAGCMELYEGHNYHEWFQVTDGVRAKFLEAGHIVGSAMVVLEITESGKTTRVGFSGDVGRSMLPIIRDPEPMEPVDVLICESTYGNRKHEDITTARHTLRDAITETAKRGGKILIPAFSLERTQEIVYDLHMLWDAKEIPAVPIYIDSPLATKVTEVFQKHPETYDKEMYENFLANAHNPFQFNLIEYTASVDESKALNNKPGPMIIMAGSGMCEAGRIRHHLRNCLEDERNHVVAVGYMAEHTLGRKVIDDEVKEVKIFDQHYSKKASTSYINAYSGHADMDDLDAFVAAVPGLKKLILVHGEEETQDIFAARLQEQHPDLEIVVPEREELITFE